MGEHAYFRGQILKLSEDFEKSVLWLADYDPEKAEKIMTGTVRSWIYHLENAIDEIIRRKPGPSIEED